MKKLILIPLIFIALATNAQTDSIQSIDEVEVSATRSISPYRDTPEVIRIIGPDEINAISPASTSELLGYISGASVETGTGSAFPKRGTVSMNGFPANYNLVLVDGNRLVSEHIHTGQNIDHIPVENIERIEIIRGASSAQYGSDAMGGIINIVTKSGSSQTEASFYGGYGRYNTIKGGIQLQTPLSNGARNSIFAGWEQSKGLPIKAPKHRMGNMGYKKLSLGNKLDVDLSPKTSGQFVTNYASNSMQWFGEWNDSWLFMPGLKLRHRLNDQLDLHLNNNFSYWNSEVATEINKVYVPELYARYRFTDQHSMVAGTDMRHHTFRRSAVEEKSQITLGAFGIFESRWNKQFATMASLRYDKVEGVERVVSPKLSAIYRPVSKLAIRASAGRGFHAPTVQELYEKGYGHSGRAYRYGNPELKPEYATTLNLSAEYELTENLMVYGNGFFNIVENMIVPVYQGVWDQDSSLDVWMRENIYEAHIYGAELNAHWQFMSGHLLEVGYTYTKSRDDSQREVYYQPGSSSYARYRISQPLGSSLRLQGFVGFIAEFNRSSWNWKPAEGAGTDNTDGLTTELSDYTKLDAGLGFVYDNRFSLMLKVDNITGEDIEYLEDAFTQIQGEPFWRVKLSYTFTEE